MSRGHAASTLALIFALQSVWPEWSIRMTLFFWNAGMKAFESGQVDISEGDVQGKLFLEFHKLREGKEWCHALANEGGKEGAEGDVR